MCPCLRVYRECAVCVATPLNRPDACGGTCCKSRTSRKARKRVFLPPCSRLFFGGHTEQCVFFLSSHKRRAGRRRAGRRRAGRRRAEQRPCGLPAQERCLRGMRKRLSPVLLPCPERCPGPRPLPCGRNMRPPSGMHEGPDSRHGARDGGCRSAAGTERVRALSCIANGRPVWRSTHGQALSSGQGLSLCLSALPRSGTPCCTRSFASSGIRVLQRSCSRTKFCHKEQTGPPDPCSCSGRAATSALLPGGLCARGRSAKSRKRENPESSERPLTGSGAEAFARPCRCQESAPARLRKSGVRDWAWVPVPRPA